MKKINFVLFFIIYICLNVYCFEYSVQLNFHEGIWEIFIEESGEKELWYTIKDDIYDISTLYKLNKERVRFSMQFYMYKAHIEQEYKKTDKELARKGWSYDMRQYALKVLYDYDLECIKKGQINESSIYHYIY